MQRREKILHDTNVVVLQKKKSLVVPHCMGGYTLLELLVVFVIIAILSALAAQIYVDHLIAIRRADAQLALLKLSTALEDYYLQHNTYEGASVRNIGIASRSPQGFYQLSFILENNGQSYRAKAQPLGAQAKQDKACGTLVLFTDGRRSYEGADPRAVCW
jgi:type IV pilus assembly protein PilE